MTTFIIFCTIPFIAVAIGMIYSRNESPQAGTIILPEGNGDTKSPANPMTVPIKNRSVIKIK
jgi:hypothetical protein